MRIKALVVSITLLILVWFSFTSTALAYEFKTFAFQEEQFLSSLRQSMRSDGNQNALYEEKKYSEHLDFGKMICSSLMEGTPLKEILGYIDQVVLNSEDDKKQMNLQYGRVVIGTAVATMCPTEIWQVQEYIKNITNSGFK